MHHFYSQCGEDKMLASIFSDKRSGTCLEVGANDGVYLSNTYHFEQLGWRCILVEANSKLCEKIRQSRKADLFEYAASDKYGEAFLYVGEGASDVYSSLDRSQLRGDQQCYSPVVVRTRTLDDILDESGATVLSFVTIDVEGHEDAALRGFTLSRWNRVSS